MPPGPLSMRPPPSSAPVSSSRGGAIPARPHKLGDYTVIGKIASGGMAAIYLGRDERSGDVVALKVMRPEPGSGGDAMVHMFLDEANLLARLVHPNIVRTLDTSADGEQRFIVMELLLGRTLSSVYDASVARGTPIERNVAAFVCSRIARALAYAHALEDDAGTPLGIIHRDVNPSNVFLTFDGDVKLFDFGMAKFAARHAKSSPGIVKGKLPYLAPEQIMQLPLDRRADLFGLGTTLWELLTMRRLFHRGSDVETVRAVHVGPIPDARSVVPEVPARLAQIAARALERNREHRYPDAGALAGDLESAMTGDEAGHRAAIGALLDSLFPTERKRQLGWRKPAITSSRTPTAPIVLPKPKA